MVRALVVDTPGPVTALRPAERPHAPLGRGDARVAVAVAGVNPVDAGNRADPAWAGLDPPYVVGYDFAGTVLEAGPDAHGLVAGDEIWGLLPVRGTRWGAYADEIVADARFVARRPPSLAVEEAAALPLAGATALQVLDRLDPRSGEWLLVHGAAGGVGHLLVQIARARGVRIAAPASAARHALLGRLGVEVIVDRHRPDAIQAARDGAGSDFAAVADLVGGDRLAASLSVLESGGSAATIVELAGDLERAIDANITLHGVLVRPGRAVLDSLAALAEAGVLRPEIDQVIPLADAARAHERIETGSGQGKLVLAVR
jgi:NADPH:quinone reductase